MAVASAGPYADNLHLAPDHAQFFTGQTLFLTPNPQRQSTEDWVTLHTHPFNSPISGSTQVSRYQKGKANLDFTEARDSEWQWHQLGCMQVCTALQTDNHASTPPLSFLTGRMPFLLPNQQRQSTGSLYNHR